MEENYNSDPDISKEPKTSSTDSKSNSKTTGDSSVQDGSGVVLQEEKEKAYEKSDEAQEYIEDVNIKTKIANESPVQGGKGMTL